MLSATALRIAVCALCNDFAGISAVSVRSGNRMRKVMRGLSWGTLTVLSSAALSARPTFNRAAVSVLGRGGMVIVPRRGVGVIVPGRDCKVSLSGRGPGPRTLMVFAPSV
jgi:hypothetical protein